jgi:hypothetical protein
VGGRLDGREFAMSAAGAWRGRRWTAAVSAVAGLAVLLGGCAVLTIDVEVYKGPLSNDEGVQAEQLAVMAIGAKPLLIQLRDRLETRHLYDGDVSRVKDFRRDPKVKHAFDYMREYTFTDDRASQVNAVLSLYKDSGGTRLGPGLAALIQATRDYDTAFRAFTRTPDDDQRFLDAITPAFTADLEAAPTPAAIVRCDSSLTVDALRKALRREYQKFLRPDRQKPDEARRSPGATNIVLAHRCLLTKGADVQRRLAQTWPGGPLADPDIAGTPLSKHTPNTLSRHLASPEVMISALATPGLADLHARLLFAPATPPIPEAASAARQEFVQRVSDIAGAWSRSREALARQWRAALDLLSLVATAPPSEASTNERLTRRLARLTSRLVEPDLLAAILRRNEAPPGLADLKARTAQKPSATSIPLRSSGRTVLRQDLEDAIRRAPDSVADALAVADALVRDLDLTDKDVDRRFQAGAARRYGLVRSPYPPDDDEEAFTATEARALTGAVLENAAGFESGRLPTGLESLILAYREATHSGDGGDTRRQLIDELVGFAQKVLFVANFSLLVDTAEIREDGFLLQAVGNAILTQADELKHAERSSRGAVRRAGADDEIRRRVWEEKQGRKDKDNPPIQCDRQALSPNASDGDAPKRVLDCLITELRYLHLLALREGGAGSDRAKYLQEALQAALEQRARFVQIRPAAAFLRNSYPVTSLQRKSAATWSNMLESHALRQFDYAGQSSEAVRAIQEFDKQFWQNVNTVRVAGAGRTNYVVTKDDVGNWYVKNFSSDPEKIIQASKSLALHAAGGSLSAGAVDKASKKLKGERVEEEKPAPEAPAPGALQRQEDKATSARAAIAADLRKVRPALRAGITAESGAITDAEQRRLLTVALDLASGETGCLRDGRQKADPLAELADLKTCRDETLGLIDEKPIHDEMKRRNEARVKAAEALVAERTKAWQDSVTESTRLETELGRLKGEASQASSEADAAETRAASAAPADRPAAQAEATRARRLAIEKASERDALQVRRSAAEQAQKSAEQRKGEAEKEGTDARAEVGKPLTALATGTLTSAREAIINAFRDATAPFITSLEQLNRDHQTALRTLLP